MASGRKAGVARAAFLQKALEPSPGPTPLVASIGCGLGTEAYVLAVTEGCSHLAEPWLTGRLGVLTAGGPGRGPRILPASPLALERLHQTPHFPLPQVALE